jgi:hypothetical protein
VPGALPTVSALSQAVALSRALTVLSHVIPSLGIARGADYLLYGVAVNPITMLAGNPRDEAVHRA